MLQPEIPMDLQLQHEAEAEFKANAETDRANQF